MLRVCRVAVRHNRSSFERYQALQRFGLGRFLGAKPAPLLGFLAGDNCPTDGLGAGEDPGLDGFVFGGGGHVVLLSNVFQILRPSVVKSGPGAFKNVDYRLVDRGVLNCSRFV